ncbi:MAG: metallophosphoesterase family protein [Candidatus Hodarchaeales archaeon]
MVRLALIGDIHGNLPAFIEVLKDIERNNVDKIYCMGDIVGYGPWPNKCVDLVKSVCEVNGELNCCMGNHDYYAVHGEIPDWFKPAARKAIEWTVRNISKESREFLSRLPSYFETDYYGYKFYMVHGSPANPLKAYIFKGSDELSAARLFMQENGLQYLIVGHTHFPLKETTFDIVPRWIINPGSVGQPRDDNNQASYCLLELKSQLEMRVEIIRIKYDIDKTAEAIKMRGIDITLSDRLYKGQ